MDVPPEMEWPEESAVLSAISAQGSNAMRFPRIRYIPKLKPPTPPIHESTPGRHRRTVQGRGPRGRSARPGRRTRSSSRPSASAISAGTELAVYTGTHQWLKDPNLPDWKFPFRPGYSAAGQVVAVGADISGWKPGDRVSYPGNHASHELLTIGHERGRLWKMPDNLSPEKAALACISRYGLGGVRSGGPDARPIARGARPGHHRPVRPALCCWRPGAIRSSASTR